MPPTASNDARIGLSIAAGVLVLAILFAWRQWAEIRDRDDEGAGETPRHRHQGGVRRAGR